MRFRLGSILISLATVGLLAPAPALTQSAEQILRTALTQHEARMQGVENYTVVQEVMGMPVTVYFEREMVDGRPMYRTRAVSAAGQAVPDAGSGWENPYQDFAELASRAQYRGTEAVDGHRTHVLEIDDVRGLAGAPTPEEMQDFELRRATLYLDAANHVLRRMVMEGTATIEGQARPVTMQARFEDYREVDGLLHPFRTVMSTEGLTPNVSAAEREEARRNLAQLEQQMQSMPAAQREMMERMVRPQMQQLQNMLAGEGMEFAIEVREVRVNAGPPAR